MAGEVIVPRLNPAPILQSNGNRTRKHEKKDGKGTNGAYLTPAGEHRRCNLYNPVALFILSPTPSRSSAEMTRDAPRRRWKNRRVELLHRPRLVLTIDPSQGSF